MKLLLTTILMLVCLVAYGATPSYSNFSSNQFLPSGTYTVTVKNQPLMTNMFEYGALSFTNAQFATVSTISNSATNMTFDAPFGTRRQFIFNTSGVTVMVISNGQVGILKANPDTGIALDVNGPLDVHTSGASGNARLFSVSSQNTASQINMYDNNSISKVQIGANNPSYFNGGNVGIGSETPGTKLDVNGSVIIRSNTFPITANWGNMTNSACVIWMSNFTCYMICTNSQDGVAYTNFLGGKP